MSSNIAIWLSCDPKGLAWMMEAADGMVSFSNSSIFTSFFVV